MGYIIESSSYRWFWYMWGFFVVLKFYIRKKNEMKLFVDFVDKFDRVVYYFVISVVICLRIL